MYQASHSKLEIILRTCAEMNIANSGRACMGSREPQQVPQERFRNTVACDANLNAQNPKNKKLNVNPFPCFSVSKHKYHCFRF